MSVSLGWARVLLKIFLTEVLVGSDWFSMLLSSVSVLLMLVAVAARERAQVLRSAGLGGRVAGLGARFTKDHFDCCCGWAWIGFPC